MLGLISLSKVTLTSAMFEINFIYGRMRGKVSITTSCFFLSCTGIVVPAKATDVGAAAG